MLKKFLGGGRSKPANPKVSSRKSKKGESPYSNLHSRKVSEADGKTAADVVLNGAERQLYKHEMPESERDFGDLIKDHVPGELFPYAAIINQPTEGYDARMRRLTTMQPHNETRRVDLPDVVNVKLFKEVEEFPLSQMLQVPSKGMKPGAFDYVSIKRATFIFGPLSSFVDSHSDVIVTLVDMRKRTDQSARTLKLQDNKQYRGEFTLDYCFPKISVDKISMSFAQEVPTFNVGEQWGACQLFLDIEESTFPTSHAFQETIGLVGLTDSMLTKYDHDPAVLNIPMRDAHITKLREMYLDGDIADETEPKSNKVSKVAYASSSGTTLKQQKKKPKQVAMGSDGGVDWSAVRSAQKPKVAIDEVSINDFDSDDEEEDQERQEHNRKLLREYQKGQVSEAKVIHSALKKSTNTPTPTSGANHDSQSISSSSGSGDVEIPIGKFANVRFPEGS